MRRGSEIADVYLAATLDCEGSISLVRSKQHGRSDHAFRLTIEVTNRSPELIDWLIENFGGKFGFRVRGGNRSHVYVWRVYGQNARPILEAALPYMIVKRRHAELALDFIEARFDSGTYHLPDDADRLHEIHAEVVELNRRGLGA